MNEDPVSVRAAIEQQIRYLGDEIHRIDGEHAQIRARLDEVHSVVRSLDTHIRSLMDDPPKLERHWQFGQGVILTQWSDTAAKAVGNRVLTFVFGAILAALIAWAVIKGGTK